MRMAGGMGVCEPPSIHADPIHPAATSRPSMPSPDARGPHKVPSLAKFHYLLRYMSKMSSCKACQIY